MNPTVARAAAGLVTLFAVCGLAAPAGAARLARLTNCAWWPGTRRMPERPISWSAWPLLGTAARRPFCEPQRQPHPVCAEGLTLTGGRCGALARGRREAR